MPVRSLHSSVLKWPDRETVHRAVEAWAREVAQRSQRVQKVGYFGSYARGNWGVGSDLDVVLLVDHAEEPFTCRGRAFDLTGLPVPADLLVYTPAEWETLRGRFRSTLRRETVWVFERT